MLHWHQLINARSMLFPNAPSYPIESSRALTAHDPLITLPDAVPWEDADEEASVLSTHDLSRRVSSFAIPDLVDPWAIDSHMSSLSSLNRRKIPTPVYSHASGTSSGFSFSQTTPRFSLSSVSTKSTSRLSRTTNTPPDVSEECRCQVRTQKIACGPSVSHCDHSAPPLFNYSRCAQPPTIRVTQ